VKIPGGSAIGATDTAVGARRTFARRLVVTDSDVTSIQASQVAEFPAVVIPLVTSHAPMLERTLRYTALTRARQLVVIVGQKRALFLAVRDWRRAPRHTALGGLLGGTLRFGWAPTPGDPHDASSDIEPALWESSGEGMA
jgi:UvrD-like helicase C-terminal domain